MEENNKEEAEAASAGREECHTRNPVSNTKGPKGKSCTGVAFYSSLHNEKSKNPTCIGFSKTLHQAGLQDKTAKLPYCFGSESLRTRGTVGQVPAHARKTEALKNKEAATSEVASAGGEACHPRNPVSSNNPNPIPDPNPNTPSTTKEGKACSGVTLYTSLHKDYSKNPTCIGFSKTLQQVPPRVLEYSNMELEASKRGWSLDRFWYYCVGYTIYLDNKKSSAGSQDKTAKLPHCFSGYAALYGLVPVGQVPARKTEEDEDAAPQPQPQRNKPPTNTENQFFNRFQKSAGVVAIGVVKNLFRVGSYV